MAQTHSKAPRIKKSPGEQMTSLRSGYTVPQLYEGSGAERADSSLQSAGQPELCNVLNRPDERPTDMAGVLQPFRRINAYAFRDTQSGFQNKDTAVANKRDNASPKAGKVVAMLGGGLLAGGLAVYLLILELVALVWVILLISLISVGLLKGSIDLSKKLKRWFKYLVHALAWPVLVVSAAILIACILIVALQDKGFI